MLPFWHAPFGLILEQEARRQTTLRLMLAFVPSSVVPHMKIIRHSHTQSVREGTLEEMIRY
jgi:hypothetical protein